MSDQYHSPLKCRPHQHIACVTKIPIVVAVYIADAANIQFLIFFFLCDIFVIIGTLFPSRYSNPVDIADFGTGVWPIRVCNSTC